MNDWTILGIEKTNDLKKVKQAYAEKTKLYHPETHPEEFQKLHNAYKRIVAEIQGGAVHQQQIQVQLPLEMNFQKEVHKPVRNTKQDEDFLTLVDEAAKNFEARHTDKRDPVQVARVEYILQHDDRNSKLLRQFQWMLYNEFFARDWRNFFINKEFLERQYEPEFINGMTEILKSRLLEVQRAKKGVYGNVGLIVYFVVVYGAIFEGIDHLQFDKHIYRKDLLQGLIDVFPLNVVKSKDYLLVEEIGELSGERYAFFLYRSILEELEKDIPAKEKIMEVIIEGFQREGISKVYFDLLLYLIASNRKNIPVFKAALAQACKMEWDSSIQDEIEILKLELTDLQEEENIEQETQTTETQREETPAKKIEKTIDISQYGYYPEDKKKLEIDEVIWKMWDFRLLVILDVLVWVLWFFHTLGILYIGYTYDATLTDWIGFSFIFFISCIIVLGVTVVPIFIARFMDEKKRILKNIHKYLPDVGDDFLEQLQADLYKGLRFMKRHNLVISDRYVIGTITDLVLNPMVIPKDQIQEIAYANYPIVTLKFYIVIQEVYFRLKNGKEIKMPVGDWGNLRLTLRALEDCGVPIIDISQEKKYGGERDNGGTAI